MGPHRPPYPDCPPFDDGSYGRWFADVERWSPHAAAVAARHGLPPPRDLSNGVPGSHPVFVAGDYVVKFYAPHWPEACDAEAAVYESLAASAEPLPVPRVVARGSLYAEPGAQGAGGGRWPWPYVVLTRIGGRSVGECRPRLRRGDLERVVAEVAPTVRWIHRCPAVRAAGEPWPKRRDGLLADASHLREAEGGWSEGLLSGLGEYVRRALGDDPCCLVHADLTEDHILVEPDGQGCRLSGLIDFGDAFIGEPSYELVALRLSLLRDEPRAQAAFRAAYGAGPLFEEGWRRRATACMLIFPYGVMGELGAVQGAARAARTCAELEDVLWRGFGGPE